MVVFYRPVNGITRQAGGRRERADAAILDPAESAIFGCRPYGAITIEVETRDMTLAQPVRRCVGRADLSVLEKQDAAVLPECQPDAAIIRDHDLGLLPTPHRRPGMVLGKSVVV